jgi:hypothetical protein
MRIAPISEINVGRKIVLCDSNFTVCDKQAVLQNSIDFLHS